MSFSTLRRVGATLSFLSCACLVACGGGSSNGETKTGSAGASGMAGAAASGTAGGGTAGDTGSGSGTAGDGSSAGSGSGGDTGAGGMVATAGAGGAVAGAGGTSTGSGGAGGGVAGAGGGTAGMGAAGASAGGAGGGVSATFPSGPSDGCGMAPMQATNMFVQHNIMVTMGLQPADVANYTSRNYYLRLPTGYDPSKKYPTVFLGPGCGGTGSSVIPVWNASMGNAIIVGLSPVGQCFKTNGMNSPDTPFFDAVLKEVESTSCVDKGRVFVAGFSSGSWLSNQLGCERANVIRGQGNATGGLPGNMPTCAGPIAAMLAHDTTDTANVIAGGEAARDRIRMINGCVGDTTVPYDAGTPSPCVQYTGCPAAYPVVWCQTTGKGHSDQIPISTIGFWKFWSSLP
jgi:hypothetical protein